MIQALSQITGFILFVPGGLEIVIGLLILILLLIIQRRFHVKQLATTLMIAFAILSFVSFFRFVTSRLGPVLAMLDLFIFLLAWGAYKSNQPRLQMALVPFAIFVYALGVHEFTSVSRSARIEADWTIDEIAPIDGTREANQNRAQRLVEFHFGEKGNQVYGIRSNELAGALEATDKETAQIELGLLYHWGRFAGDSLETVDGIQLPPDSDAYATCTDPCVSPFPEFDFKPKLLDR